MFDPEFASGTDKYFLRTRDIVAANGDVRATYALFMRVPIIFAPRIMFDWPRPNMEQVERIVSGMVGRLLNAPVMVAAPGDPECGSRAGYVRGFRPPIVLCPRFFSSSPEQQIRTMIHESAHLMRIGNAGPGEGYCVMFTCESSCPGGFDSADSWAQYVHCLSNQTPDQPEPVRAGGSRR